MDTFSPIKSSAKKKKKVNPFVQAIQNAETEQGLNRTNIQGNSNHALLSETLSKTGNKIFDSPTNFDSKATIEKTKKEEQLKAERKRLHDMINPVDTHNVFSQNEIRVKRAIEEVRKELKSLSKEIEEAHKEIVVTLMTETAEPGAEGIYYKSFFNKLRETIILFKAHVHSARHWLRIQNAKNKKAKAKKRGPFGRIAMNKTEAIHKAFKGNEMKSNRSGG
jgi:hypothetical protein